MLLNIFRLLNFYCSFNTNISLITDLKKELLHQLFFDFILKSDLFQDYGIVYTMLLESHAEQFNHIVLGKTAEFWTEKHDACLKLTKTVESFADSSPDVIIEKFTISFFKFLKEPIRILILDLRSQQVKVVSSLLISLTEIAPDQLKYLIRDVYAAIFDAVKVPSKLMSGYVDECILIMIRNATLRFIIPSIVQEICESKAGKVREKFVVCTGGIYVY